MFVKLAAVGALVATSSCTNQVEAVVPCNIPDKVKYSTDIYPIIETTCAIPNCHVAGFEYGDFSDSNEVKQVAESGCLEFMIVTKQMPAGFTTGPAYLTDCQINTIRAWIKSGAVVN